MADLKAYLWSGPDILKRYSSGSVLVLAPSLDAAWDKLKQDEPEVWIALQTQEGYVYYNEATDESPETFLENSVRESGRAAIKPEPKVFELDDLPAIAAWGGE